MNTFNTVKPFVVLGERKFPLNNSESKFASVGLCYNWNFAPYIQLSGKKDDQVVFNESEWKHFLTYRGMITNYLCSNEAADSVDAGDFMLEFKQIQSRKVLKVLKDNSSIYLAYETICTLWELLPLIRYRVDILQRQQFGNYFRILQKGLQGITDPAVSVYNLLQPDENPNSENTSMVLEFLHIHPKIFKQELSVV